MPQKENMAGEFIGGCRIEKLLKCGGMGAVYLAWDAKLKRNVAIKLLDRDLILLEDCIKRFEREAKILADLNHPNIATVHKAGRCDGRPFYIMEYIDGPSLADVLKERGKLAGSKCIHYLSMAASGLKAAAESNIIHRDIKPANIMLNSQGELKIVDFGISKVYGEDTLQTKTGTIMGTPRYMSPEQGRGWTVDLRSDIYSLGATFYHLVTGEPPFKAENAMTLMMMHINDPVRDIKQINANIPEKFCNVIYGMLMKDPEDRFQNYNQLLHALNTIHRTDGDNFSKYSKVALHPNADNSSPESTSEIKTQQNKINTPLIIGALFLIAFILALMLRPGKNTPEITAKEPTKEDETPKRSKTIQLLRDIHEFQNELKEESEIIE